jgi:hypothetical protein
MKFVGLCIGLVLGELGLLSSFACSGLRFLYITGTVDISKAASFASIRLH